MTSTGSACVTPNVGANIFVSYSEDDRLAATLISTLRAAQGVNLFIAHQIRTPGMSLQSKIRNGIAHCDLVLLLWSQNSCDSQWVNHEIETSLSLRKRILPVLLEDIELPGSLRDIEALPLFQDPDRAMNWLSRYVRQLASGSGEGFKWANLIKAGFLIAGLFAATSSQTSDTRRANR